jgi:uncharacterized protein (TIGR02453 family)
MAFFTNDFLDFFKELAANNHKDWFDVNRKRYHESIKKPFDNFLDSLINELKKTDNEIDIQAKDAVFRINRDIRFSKDKTPYKLNRSAIINPGGKKNKSIPGLYFEFSPEHVRIYTGAYQPDKFQLQSIREEIANNLTKFNKIITEKEFVKNYQEVRGEKNVRIPKEFKEAGEKQPLIFNKNFYVYTTLQPEVILQDDLIKIINDSYKIAEPFAQFLKKPITMIE